MNILLRNKNRWLKWCSRKAPGWESQCRELGCWKGEGISPPVNFSGSSTHLHFPPPSRLFIFVYFYLFQSTFLHHLWFLYCMLMFPSLLFAFFLLGVPALFGTSLFFLSFPFISFPKLVFWLFQLQDCAVPLCCGQKLQSEADINLVSFTFFLNFLGTAVCEGIFKKELLFELGGSETWLTSLLYIP